LHSYAEESFPAGRPFGAAITSLMNRIYADFEYSSTATTVSTRLPAVLSKRAGVCQDFAHLAVGCLRSIGLPARYVSGYLATTPPPGMPRLVGADASHAWAEVFVPHTGWVGFDPTNNHYADVRYATTAWGRDYGDVPPVKGVIFTESKSSTMTVSVDMAPA
jgi:transglutaminase-like putative cysteine protease